MRARELLGLGEADRAAYQLTEALTLWRGSPFSELEEWAPAVSEAGRLGELRLEAEELRVDALLRAGRHAEVLAEVQTMVRAAPLRERRWVLQAHAQYQAGNQGEALRTLHQLKSVLTTRLGVDPGPDVAASRRDRLDAVIEELAIDSEFTPVLRRLGCLRGIGTLTGFGLAVEVGDWHRFTGKTIGSFVGLVPSEHSSGGSRSQGSITKTGNGHARRLLVEAAWHHRARYTIGKTMRGRWDLAPAAARVRGDEGNRRLHHRWVKFNDRNKKTTIANVAIARELAGWCWSLAVLEE